MLKSLIILFGFILFQAQADAKIAAGAMIGSFTALSFEYAGGQKSTYDGGLAFDVGNDKKFYLHGAKLFQFPNSLKISGQVLSWYYGLGARYLSFDKKKSDDDYRLGARASLGISYLFASVPIKVFAEGATVVNIIPKTSADLDILIGGRYYF